MLTRLVDCGYTVQFVSHAAAIIGVDFPQALLDLESVLVKFAIPIEELVGSGGGETKGTQRLRRTLADRGWKKHNFVIERRIDGEQRGSISHEVDHVRKFEAGTLGLEIEWNNKDPFFDRDLENFKRLHAEGAISAGIIVTRGPDLQRDLPDLILRFAERNSLDSTATLSAFGVSRTARQQRDIEKSVAAGRPFRQAWVDNFCQDKYGTATTHWQKLQDRLHRGVGNPCPLLLIGIPSSVVRFGG